MTHLTNEDCRRLLEIMEAWRGDESLEDLEADDLRSKLEELSR